VERRPENASAPDSWIRRRKSRRRRATPPPGVAAGVLRAACPASGPVGP